MISVKKSWIYGVALGLLVFSCGNDRSGQSSDRVEEIPLEESFSNADIIRNPVSANQQTDTSRVAKIAFENPIFNYGEIFEGDVVSHEFHFTNTGSVPLLITDARSTCGCTVPRWPAEPIPPGEEGVILVQFDSDSKEGLQHKPVTITANTYPAQTQIYIRGKVLPKSN